MGETGPYTPTVTWKTTTKTVKTSITMTKKSTKSDGEIEQNL